MALSKRLQELAELVPEGRRVVDVGCDHGYLPIELVRKKKIPGAVAMDVRPGPLERARKNIAAYGLEKYIETRLSDGLQALRPGEGEVLVIAGMGGPLMERILTRGAVLADAMPYWVLQPQSDVPRFRRFLQERNRKTVQERMVCEDGKYYPMMLAVPGHSHELRDIDYLYGRLLLEEKDQVLLQYLRKELQQKGQLLEQLAGAGTGAARRRAAEIQKEIAQLEAALKSYEM